MTLQAFIDDSYDAGGVYVLAGHIASEEAWNSFSNEWRELLPLALKKKNGAHYFKMSHLAQARDGMPKAEIFFRVIERHVLASISCMVDIRTMQRVKERIWVPGLEIDWSGFLDNPFIVTWRCLLDMFQTYRKHYAEFIPADEKIDFFFDTQEVEAKEVHQIWKLYMESRAPEIRALFGAEPRFENDEKFLPLQAADFWAWWVRKWCKEGSGDQHEFSEFKGWKVKREVYPRIHFSFDEESLLAGVIDVMRGELMGHVIYDAKQFPGPSFYAGGLIP